MNVLCYFAEKKYWNSNLDSDAKFTLFIFTKVGLGSKPNPIRRRLGK